MILYVDMEHEIGRTKPWGEQIMAGRLKIKYRIEEITGGSCLITHYPRVSMDFLEISNFEAILLSGSGTDPDQYSVESLAGISDLIRTAPIPILGLCGGWQFMAQAFGETIRPLGKWAPDEPPPDSTVVFREGYRQEYGYHPVTINSPHPLLKGVQEEPIFWHAHYLQVDPVPAGFQVYASTDLCEVQFAAHTSLPLFGSQFHPEYYDDTHPDGRIVLENFFKMAGVLPA